MKDYSIGIDIVENNQIQKAIKQFGNTFLKRVFHPLEIRDCKNVKFYAAMFAAKEAFLKALGTGWVKGINWNEIEVKLSGLKNIQVILHGKTRNKARQKGIKNIFGSVSIDGNCAISQVIVERI